MKSDNPAYAGMNRSCGGSGFVQYPDNPAYAGMNRVVELALDRLNR